MVIDNKTIAINVEKTSRTEMENSVISSIKEFLESDRKKILDMCFSSIRNDKNERIFKNTIDELDDNSFDSLFPLVSNVILTANKIECDSLNYIASKQENYYVKKRKHNLPIIPNHNVGVADVYVFKMDSFYMLHINAFETGSNTPGGSTDIVRFISNHPLLKPKSIISFGVCYGRNPNKQNIGDVIIPQKLYPWSIGQKIIDKTLVIKNDDFNLWLFSLFDKSNIYPVLRDFCNGEDGKTIIGFIKLADSTESQRFEVKVIMGNMSTGEAVVSSEDAKEIIIEATGNYKELGGEMEGYGIAKECVYYANIPCLILKSICDWGVLKNIDDILKEEGINCPTYFKDKLQSYASFCAGIVLFKLFEDAREIFYLPDFIQSLAKTLQGRNFLKGNTGCTEKKILRKLKRYYNDDKISKSIFEILIKQEFISNSLSEPNEYIINKELIIEVNNNGNK